MRKVKKEKESKDLLKKIIEYSSTSRSHALDLRDAQLMSNGSTEHKAIREVFSLMSAADLLNLRIQDFLELAKFFEIQNKKTLEYEAEITVQNMISLYQQNLLDEDSLLQFFKKMEETDISSLFENEEVILNEGKRPRLMVCFQEIQKYKLHIRKDIFSEIYINTNHPEEYIYCIPDICQEKLKEYASRFQTMFMFKVWSIWEERQYIKLYPSV